jgi:hypothetical protein
LVLAYGMRPILCAYALLPFVAACNKAEPPSAAQPAPSSPPAAASHAQAPRAEPPSAAQPAPSSPPAAASRAEAEAPTTPTLCTSKGKLTLYGFRGKIGNKEEVRLAFAQADTYLEGMYAGGFEAGGLRGEMKDATHLVLSEVLPSDAQPPGITIAATMQGGTLTGTWTDGGSAPESFSATPLVLGKEDASFDETYGGALGTDISIRAELKRSAANLTGRYHYLGKQEDLRLEGTIQDDGAFVLHESTGKGTPTGTFTGVLLDKRDAFGRWTSPRGSRCFPFVLSAGDGVSRRSTQEELDSKAVSLPGGPKVTPRETYAEPAAYCTGSVLYPFVTGAANAPAQAVLDDALKAAFDALGNDPPLTCDQETNTKLRSSRDVSYEVSAVAKEAFAMSTSTFQFNSRAVHPLRTVGCYVADLDKGTVTETVAKLLSAGARAKVEAIADKGLKAAFDDRRSPLVSDTTLLCVDHDQLTVQFNLYEVDSYAAGTPAVPIAHADAAPLVKGTVLEPFFR